MLHTNDSTMFADPYRYADECARLLAEVHTSNDVLPAGYAFKRSYVEVRSAPDGLHVVEHAYNTPTRRSNTCAPLHYADSKPINEQTVYSWQYVSNSTCAQLEETCAQTGEVLRAVPRCAVAEHGPAFVLEWPYPEDTDGNCYTDEDAARAAGLVQCDCCEAWHEEDGLDAVQFDGLNFCSIDCAHDYGFEQCEHCGEWHNADDSVVVDGRYGISIYCSDVCAENDGNERCCECGDWHDDMDDYTDADGDHYCESCAENVLVSCYECGELVREDRAEYIDGDYYCENCAGRQSARIHSYGYEPTVEFFGDADAITSCAAPSLGFELEIDDGDDRNALAEALADAQGDYLYFMRDGSLSDAGVEIVSQPATIDYIASSKVFDDCNNYGREYGFTSHDAGTCGLHVHTGRAYFMNKQNGAREAAAYMAAAIYNNRAEFKKFSRRNDSQMRWCSIEKMQDVAERVHEWYTAYEYLDDGDRYKAVNATNGSTIELRLFRGTLNATSALASVALVDGLTRWAAETTADEAATITWDELITAILRLVGDDAARAALVAYLDARGLNVHEAETADEAENTREDAEAWHVAIVRLSGLEGVRRVYSNVLPSFADAVAFATSAAGRFTASECVTDAVRVNGGCYARTFIDANGYAYVQYIYNDTGRCGFTRAAEAADVTTFENPYAETMFAA